MRLIDADKLLPKLWVCYEENKPIVDGEPTIEAIPIEWVRKYINHRTVEFGDMWVFINCMIKDWEKENERCNFDN